MNKMNETTNSFLCPYCGCKKELFYCNLSSKINQRKVNYYKCNDCGAVIQFPYPSKDVLQKYYESYFDIKQTLNAGYLTENQYNSLKAERNQTLEELKFDKERIKKGINVELGCANGLFLRYLTEYGGTKVLGIDVSYPLLEEAQKRLDSALLISSNQIFDTDISCNVQLLCDESLSAITENSVDNLYMFHLMEHAVKPDELMKQAAFVLRKGGILVLEVPVSGLISSFFRSRWRFFMPDEHLNIPSVRSIKVLAKHYGFSICSMIRFGSGITSGTAPKMVKKIADRLAKKFRIGDRAAFLLIKN